MTITYALFSPEGVLPANKSYWWGAGILIALAALLQFLGYYFTVSSDDMSGMMRGSLFSILSWTLIYPYFCLYGKRLRDTGRPATWFLLVLAIYVIANMIVQAMITMPIMFGEMQGMMEQMEGAMPADDDEAPDLNKVMDAQMGMQKAMMRKIIWPTIISGAFVSAVISGVMGSLKTNRDNNPFRPASSVFE